MHSTRDTSEPLGIEERFSFEPLDYFRVRDELISRLQSDISIPLVKKLHPMTDDASIDSALAETNESRSFIDSEKSLPVFSQMDDLRPITLRAEKGSLLGIEEILAVARTVRLLRVASDAILNARFEYTILGRTAGQVLRFPELEEHISKCIHPEGWVLDSASPELRKIRKSLEHARAEIEERLRHLVQKFSRKGYLREDNFTMRNGRYVLPFRSEHLRTEDVVIQSASDTRQTFFVEPIEMVERNNKLQTLLGAEAAEVERILYELSNYIGNDAAQLRYSLENGMRLDFIFAKGRLSSDWRAVAAGVSDEIAIRGVKHPFLHGDIIPVDIVISGRKGLIITGPNAGGKTVSLKSMGLCVLLNQSGLHVPTGYETSLPRFESVLAEIGDRQNIDLSLSSFSAHIEFLKGMIHTINNASSGKPSLVLLDEIGRSTDPQEGSALALAVIEYLIDKGAYFAITTHLPALKNLVMKRADALTAASVDFDIEKVEPRYSLLLDSLGASYALLMSERFGLDRKLVERAKEIVGQGTDLLEIDITLLQTKRDALRIQVDNLERESASINDKRAKLVVLQNYVMADILDGVTHALEYARDVVSKALKQRDSILKQTAKVADKPVEEGGIRDSDFEELERTLTKIRRKRNLMQVPGEALIIQSEEPLGEDVFEVGDKVWLIDLKKEGRIIGDGRKGQYKVAVESLKMTIDGSGLRKIEEQYEARAHAVKTPIPAAVLGQLDLHGERVEQGLLKLDEYLDKAYYAKKAEVSIVHGIGTGQLRRAVQEHLKKHDLVESFRSGTPNEGGVGATIVRFKE